MRWIMAGLTAAAAAFARRARKRGADPHRTIETVHELRELLAETVRDRKTLTIASDRLPAKFAGHLMADLGRIAADDGMEYTAEFTPAGIRLAPAKDEDGSNGPGP